ncbi:MAG: nucleotidyltransferase family protein [Melioribacteraceae bacterium]|nr:nucleotidyltransferase family protein [Melioribacteraceae bacterium]
MTKTHIEEILLKNKAELKSKFGVIEICLFGSYARGEENFESDIDIAVVIDKTDLLKFVSLKYYLQHILGKKVDLVRLRENMNTLLKTRIDRDALYVR